MVNREEVGLDESQEVSTKHVSRRLKLEPAASCRAAIFVGEESSVIQLSTFIWSLSALMAEPSRSSRFDRLGHALTLAADKDPGNCRLSAS